MILIYKKLSEKDFRLAIKQLNTWFAKNPKREVCLAERWGGIHYKIRRNHVAEDIRAEYKKVTS